MSLETGRLVGYVCGKPDVERLDTDSDDFYNGFCEGTRAMCDLFAHKPDLIDDWSAYAKVWDSIGEPMTLEELAELEEVDEEVDEEVYYEGFSDGKRVGFEEGFDCGYKESQEYNVILDGEILDQIYDFKEQILNYRKEPLSENHEHNNMVFEIHKGLMELTETWVMNQVWDYWYKRKEELGE